MSPVFLTGLASSIQVVKASGTIYIRADGSIDPSIAPISTFDHVTYTLNQNIAGSIVVERNNVVVDGMGFKVQGSGGDGTGFYSYYTHNVTIKNFNIELFGKGIFLNFTSQIFISGNNITSNWVGIRLSSSSTNSIIGNNIRHNVDGVQLDYSNNNTLSGNDITANYFFGASIVFYRSSDNNIVANTISSSWYGMQIFISINNSVYHNSFISNTHQVFIDGSINFWDDGYPSGGNYWSDYGGVDTHSGVCQNEALYDWIGDSPYVIDENNMDRYPLTYPFVPETEEVRIAYRNLMLKYSQSQSDFEVLNSTVKDLQESINDLMMTFNSTRDNLQGQIGSLTNTVASLSQSLTNLQAQYNSLLSSHNNLTVEFARFKEQMENDLSVTRNLAYISLALILILLLTTIYFATRKPKTETTKEKEKGPETPIATR
jgi:parallel beta-helix repeat protein